MVKKRIKKAFRVSRYIIYKETLVDYKEIACSFFGAFLGIALIAFFQSSLLTRDENIFLIGGHIISAIIGVSVYKFLPDIIWLTAPLAVALSIVMMQISKTLHPPGGATALIAIIGSPKIKALGYLYVLSPVLTGSLILFVVAFLFNNMTRNRKYPTNSRFTKSFRKALLDKRKNLRNEAISK